MSFYDFTDYMKLPNISPKTLSHPKVRVVKHLPARSWCEVWFAWFEERGMDNPMYLKPPVLEDKMQLSDTFNHCHKGGGKQSYISL